MGATGGCEKGLWCSQERDRLTKKALFPGERGLDGLSRSTWGARRWLLQIHPGDRRPPSAPPPACSRSPLKMAQWWKWSTLAGFVPRRTWICKNNIYHHGEHQTLWLFFLFMCLSPLSSPGLSQMKSLSERQRGEITCWRFPSFISCGA